MLQGIVVDGKADGLVGAGLFMAKMVKCGIARNPEQPGRKLIPKVIGCKLLEGLCKTLHAYILYLFFILHIMRDMPLHSFVVTGIEGIESGLRQGGIIPQGGFNEVFLFPISEPLASFCHSYILQLKERSA